MPTKQLRSVSTWTIASNMDESQVEQEQKRSPQSESWDTES
jgi:hypothetical protein